MKSSALSLSLIAALSLTAAAQAASIDMNAPHRALGREDDVRVDAQIAEPNLSPGSPIGVVYQIQNFTSAPVAVADRVSDASYDADTRTITLAIGSEVPPDGNLPHLVVIPAGEKLVLRTAATPLINSAAFRSSLVQTPRYLRIKVAILRDLSPYAALIREQSRVPQRLSDELFERWFESNDTIFLNSVPVQYLPPAPSDVEASGARPIRRF